MEGIVLALFICLLLVVITKYPSVPAIPFYILAVVLLGKPGSDWSLQMRSVTFSQAWD